MLFAKTLKLKGLFFNPFFFLINLISYLIVPCSPFSHSLRDISITHKTGSDIINTEFIYVEHTVVISYFFLLRSHHSKNLNIIEKMGRWGREWGAKKKLKKNLQGLVF